MTNFLTTLRTLDAAATKGPISWDDKYPITVESADGYYIMGPGGCMPSAAPDVLLWTFLRNHAAAIIGCVEAAQALLKTQKAEEHCGDPNCDICIDYRHLVSALAALEEK